MGEPETESLFPLQDFIGFQIERGEGEASASVELAAHHHNPNGVAHGAIVFALIDTAMGAATVSVLDDGKTCATIEIHTRYLRAAREGTLTATAQVISSGRRIVHLTASATNDKGELVVSASGSFAVIEQRTAT